MIVNHQRLFIKDYLFVAGIWFSAFAGLLPVVINKIALYLVVPAPFLLTLLSEKSLTSNKYMNLLTVLYLWILLSLLWATDIDYAMVQVKQILGSFLLCFIFSQKAKYQKFLPWLYLSFIVLLIGDWYYAYNNMFDVIEFGVDRLNDDKLNANTLGYHTFYATFAIFILGEWNQRYKRLFRVLFIIMIPLSFMTAMYTASRQILLIQIPLIILLLYGRYFKSVRASLKIITLIVTLLVSLILTPRVMNLYEGSSLQERNEIEVKDDVRVQLMLDAFEVGNRNFPLGVGANNYILHSYNQHISHNTYLELYANEGIIGVLLYIIMLYLFLKTQWRRYRCTRDMMYFYFFIAGIIFAIDGFFYVFYPHLWLISFFILVASHSEAYYKQCKLSV